MRARGSIAKFSPEPGCGYPGEPCTCIRPRWRIRAAVSPDPLTGKMRRKTKVMEAPHTRRGEGRAETALAELIAEAEQQRRDEKNAPERMTVNEALDRWVEHNRPRWSGKSLSTHQFAMAKIRPRIGTRLVSSLTVGDLEKFYGVLEREGVGAPTIRKVHMAMSGCLTLAARWGAIVASPARDAKPPRVYARDIDPPEPGTLAAGLARLLEDDPDMGAWILIAAGTGMRPGEQCGLRWGDVDLDAGTVRVMRAVAKGKPDEPTWVVRQTKTKRGRQVAIGAGVVAALRAVRERQAEQHAVAGSEPNPNGYVFTLNSLEPDAHTDPELWSHRWGAARPVPKDLRADPDKPEKSALRDRYGMAGVKLYAMRHVAATTMIAAGHDPAAVAAQLGHSPNVLMATYAHPIGDNRRAAADDLDAAITPRA